MAKFAGYSKNGSLLYYDNDDGRSVFEGYDKEGRSLYRHPQVPDSDVPKTRRHALLGMHSSEPLQPGAQMTLSAVPQRSFRPQSFVFANREAINGLLVTGLFIGCNSQLIAHGSCIPCRRSGSTLGRAGIPVEYLASGWSNFHLDECPAGICISIEFYNSTDKAVDISLAVQGVATDYDTHVYLPARIPPIKSPIPSIPSHQFHTTPRAPEVKMTAASVPELCLLKDHNNLPCALERGHEGFRHDGRTSAERAADAPIAKAPEAPPKPPETREQALKRVQPRVQTSRTGLDARKAALVAELARLDAALVHAQAAEAFLPGDPFDAERAIQKAEEALGQWQEPGTIPMGHVGRHFSDEQLMEHLRQIRQ